MKVFATALMAVFASATALPTDNSLGTWKLNVGKSDYSPGPLPYKSLTMVRTAAEGGINTTITAQRLDGSWMKISYKAKYDGAPYSIAGTGHPSDTISAKQLDANTFTSERQKPGGKYHVIGRFVVSKDRKTMTNTLSGTNADGKPTKATIVYERQ
jgi:hypothetical protein